MRIYNLFIFFCICRIALGQPFITKTIPPVMYGMSGNDVTLYGKGFNEKSFVTVNEKVNASITWASETKLIIYIPTFQFDTTWFSLVVTTDVLESNVFQVPTIFINRVIQNNSVVLLEGRFGDEKNIELSTLSNSFTSQLNFLNSTHLYFFTTPELVEADEFYVKVLGYAIFKYWYLWRPIISSIEFTQTQAVVTGYNLARYPVSVLIEESECVLDTVDSTNILCTPPESFFFKKSVEFNVVVYRHYNKDRLSTTITHHLASINGIQYSSTSPISILYLETSESLHSNYLNIGGLTERSFSIDYVLEQSIYFTYSTKFQCGYVFVGLGPQRLSTSTLWCPKPIISDLSVSNNNDIGGQLIVKGYYLNDKLFNSSKSILHYQVLFKDGSKIDYKDSPSVDQNFVYTISCSLPPRRVASKFIVIKDTTTFIGAPIKYSPIVKNSTPLKYQVPGIVTIVGEFFLSSSTPPNVVVKIGGSQCSDVIVNTEGNQITCQFNADVSIVNNEPLQVSVVVDDTFIGSANVFLYTKETISCPIGSNGQVCSSHG
ncbi:hypothetical protein CYY_010170, partial [Polysphondylium violaceum]